MTDAKAAAASQAAPQAAKNTDREIWREHPDDYYADSIHVTEGGGIGLDCGGHVIVMPIRKWHALAAETRALPASGQAAALCNGDSHVLTAEGCQCGAYKIVKDRTDVENEQRERLKKRLAGRPRPPRDAFEDIGVPMLNEDKPSATPPTFESDAALVEASALAISRARLEEARLWLQAGWDLTDSADRRYGERRISELECQADAPPVEAVGQQGADAIAARVSLQIAHRCVRQHDWFDGEACRDIVLEALKGTSFAGDAASETGAGGKQP